MPSLSGSAASSVPWLVVDGNRVREGADGPVYRATGYNCYVARPAGGTAGQTLGDAQRDRFFASLRPNSLVRCWFYSPMPNTYSWAAVHAQNDKLVASAKRYGHRLVAGLANWQGHANCGTGPAKTTAWFTSRAWRTSVSGSASLQAWTEQVAARYANEPTVAIYDLMNEPLDTNGAVTADIALFAREMSGYVKTAAPNALVYMGVMSATRVGGSAAYTTIMGELDFCSLHDYAMVGQYSAAYTGSTGATARATGKPVLIDEFGFWSKAQYGADADSDKDLALSMPAVSVQAQGQLTESYLRSAFAHPEVFAALAWSWMDTDGSWYDGSGMYEPLAGSPARAAIASAPLDGLAAPLTDTVTGVAAWVDATSFAGRYKPGRQVGGPNSYPTINDRLFDRGPGATEYRQATQAAAPYADVWRDTTGCDWPTLRFAGSNWFTTVALSGSETRHHLVAVIVPTAYPDSGQKSYLVAPHSDTAGFAVWLDSDGKINVGRAPSTGTPAALVAGTSTDPLSLGGLAVVDIHWAASAPGGWSIRVNGIDQGSGTQVATFGNDITRIGADRNGANGFRGHILEFVQFNAQVAAGDRARTYTYLTGKYTRRNV